MIIYSMCIFKFNKSIKPTDTKDIMTSVVNKRLKLDTKIVVPENFVGLIFYREKYLQTLQSGEYKLQGDIFSKVFEKNLKRNKKSKKPLFDFIIHYVNTSRQKFQVECKKILAFKQVRTYNLNCVYEIENPRQFASHLLVSWFKTTNARTLKYIDGWFHEFMAKILSKKMNNLSELNSKVFDMGVQYFKKYGINIVSMNLTSDGNAPIGEEKIKIYSEDISFNSEPKIPAKKEAESDSFERFCPRCQSAIKLDVDFCPYCGYGLNRFRK